MANQYSITVSDESDRILKAMKENGYKTSQVIDEAIRLLQQKALTRLVAYRRQRDSIDTEKN
jgi:predicted CopG family antitoxin